MKTLTGVGRPREVCSYPYEIPDGDVGFEIVRYSDKSFRPRYRVNGRWKYALPREYAHLIYRLPRVLEAIKNNEPAILLAEGEKDVEALEGDGRIATTGRGGAETWTEEMAEWFRDYTGTVVIVADRDEAGYAGALKRAKSFTKIGVDWIIVEATHGKDAYDHLAKGLSSRSFRKLDGDALEFRLSNPYLARIIIALTDKAVDEPPREMSSGEYSANCPAHDDTRASLSVGAGDPEAVVANCHAGCTYEEILAALEIPVGELKWKGKRRKKHRVTSTHDDALIGETSRRNLTDDGNAQRLADLYGRTFRYISQETIWKHWDGKRWENDPGIYIQEAARDMVRRITEVEAQAVSELHAPDFPEGYPFLNKKGEPVPLSIALIEDPVKVSEWLAADAGRLEWLGNRLEAERSSSLHEVLRKHGIRSESASGIQNAIRLARSDPTFRASDADFDSVRGSFTLLNGTFDTVRMELGPHAIDELNTRICPLRLDYDAKAVKFRAFMEKNQPDKATRQYVQKLIGYSLTGECNQKLIAFLYSLAPDTGKSLFLSVIEALFGSDYALTLAKGALSPRVHGESGRDPDRMALKGKRFVVASEFRANELMDESFVKQITGGDGVSTRQNFARNGNERWQPECLVVVATNHLARVSAEDEAIWSRIHVIPWNVSFPKFLPDGRSNPERNDNLAQEIIANEMPGVLVWGIEGLAMYRREGLVPPPEVVEASLAYRSDADAVQKWLSDATEEGEIAVSEEEFSKVADLHKIYEAWAKSNNMKDILGRSKFSVRLQELGFEQKKRTKEPDKGLTRMHGAGIPDRTVIKYRLNFS